MADRGRRASRNDFVVDIESLTTPSAPSASHVPQVSGPMISISSCQSASIRSPRDDSLPRHHSRTALWDEELMTSHLANSTGTFGDNHRASNFSEDGYSEDSRRASDSSEDGPFGDSQCISNWSEEDLDRPKSEIEVHKQARQNPERNFSQYFSGLADLLEEYSGEEEPNQVYTSPRRNGDSNAITRDRATGEITWQFRESSEGAVQERKVRFEKTETDQGRRDAVPYTLRQRSVIAKDALKRGSIAALEALGSINMLREIGNPLEMSVNETRRLSSAPFGKRDSFEGRRKTGSWSINRWKSSTYGYPTPQSATVQRAADDPDDFVIQRVAALDDIEHMPNWKRVVFASAPLWALLAMASYWTYFGLRIRYILSAQTVNQKIYIMAWIFIAVEICVAIPMVMHRSWSVLMVRGRRRPKLRLVGPSVPSVDVIITCCGEDDDLILNTAMAACNVDYPADRFRVLILDDGASSKLRALVEDPKHPFDNMHYLSRPKYPGVPHHFKAGNLNYALAETKLMPGGAANFFAALDADMIPEKDWLRALLPHMLQDPKCSMACPPQQFYNVPEDDPLCQSLDTFVHISEPLKDALGVAWCTGSGYVMRRDALDSIGWFPIGSLAEDVCTSSMLLGAGWNTCFVHEPLQFGTVPDSLTGHLRQRTRWTVGTIQTSLKLRFCLYGPLVKHMTFMQRASGFVYTVSSLFIIFLVLSMFTIPIVLYSGGTLVPYVTNNQLIWLIRSCFLTMVLNRINEIIVYLPAGYGVGQRDSRGMMWMAPYHALAVFQSFILPSWMGGKIAVFTSTGSQSSALNERNEKLRAPLWKRLKVTIWDCQAYIHLLYILFVLGSIGLSTYYCFSRGENNDLTAIFLYLLTHAAWPPVLWFVCIIGCWTPIQYAISPPTVPDYEDLMTVEANSGVAYPSEEAKKVKQSKWHLLHEIQYSFFCIYTVVLFALTWWI